MIGRTPLVRLHRFEREVPAGVELYAKAEWQNPGGSVKDRAAARMILEGEASGKLTPGRTILDATSGNTGIAYAMVGAARGYAVKLCVPENASPERKLMLRALGAELVLTDPLEGGTDGAIREARRLYAEDPDQYFYPDQYNNDANWRAHYDTTGPEIIEQTSGRLTHFVAGLGTSGTFVGTGRRLRQFNPGDPADFVSARRTVPRARRAEAHGVGDRAGHLRSVAGRRGSAHQHRARARDGAAAGARGGAAGRHLVGRGARRDARRGAPARARVPGSSSRCFPTAPRST